MGESLGEIPSTEIMGRHCPNVLKYKNVSASSIIEIDVETKHKAAAATSLFPFIAAIDWIHVCEKSIIFHFSRVLRTQMTVFKNYIIEKTLTGRGHRSQSPDNSVSLTS